MNLKFPRHVLAAVLFASALSTSALAANFNIPTGELKTALDTYMKQAGVTLMYPEDEMQGVKSKGARGDLSSDVALERLLHGTGFVIHRTPSGVIAVVRDDKQAFDGAPMNLAAAPAPSVSGASLETVTVTSSKIGGDVQNIPISITALSQEQLTQTQTAGGPDLVKQVPNMTFTKTNFSGYSIQLRGIGTQAISVTTDPAVAVAFNDIPFIRNHFFEQEFYDVSQVQVLRGPQGTLYGRNATAGVVNLTSAKPSDQFEAMASGDVGNYGNRRLEGMINIPIVDDRVDLRIAGEWTKRQGYSFNDLTDARIDGRDLWSGHVTLGFKPTEKLQAYLVWEHFSEDDDRMRTSKQLCKTAPDPATIDGIAVEGHYVITAAYDPIYYVSQGCEAASLYSPDAYQVPNGLALPYASAIGQIDGAIRQLFDPYASTAQSRNLRVIESTLNPTYRAKNDTLELNADYTVTPVLTFTSQTGYNHDFLWSAEDYNRFNTAPGIFAYVPQVYAGASFQKDVMSPDPSGIGHCEVTLSGSGGSCTNLAPGAQCTPSSLLDQWCQPDGVFCDPQLGCSNRLVAEDLSDEHAWQLSQEFRLSSNFSGPFNFSVGGNYLHYETEENYYVFINTLTNLAAMGLGGGARDPSQQAEWIPGVSDDSQCLPHGFVDSNPFAPHDPTSGGCAYIDPNPITSLNNEGHNYFLSQNPYALNSYAAFGEAYYNVFSDLKLTLGARWTDDQKHFVDIPSELLVNGYGYATTGVVNQQWDQWTGRAAANWTPKLDFTDQTLVYASYSHGYKAGGANPPGATLLTFANGDIGNPIHPLTFKPEFIDAFELGSKNTLLDGALTLNGDLFYYNYENYQISRIVDRTAINDNFDAHVKGAELEATYEPIPGLRLNFGGGWEDTALAKGSHSVDLMDRTAGDPNWILIKPFITQASNCILPKYMVAAYLNTPDFFSTGLLVDVNDFHTLCAEAYTLHIDPVTQLPYVPNPTISARSGLASGGASFYYLPPGYKGFDPLSVDPNAPADVNNGLGLPENDGQGIDKDLSGKELPNAPPFTVSAGAQYTLPLSTDWAGTLRGDYYWQDYSWARVFNDNPYDRLRGYTNVNVTLIFTNQNGWQVMLYDKNIFNTTAITGDFLNSDDSGLTTNVFLTDPKLIGIRVTKNW